MAASCSVFTDARKRACIHSRRKGVWSDKKKNGVIQDLGGRRLQKLDSSFVTDKIWLIGALFPFSWKFLRSWQPPPLRKTRLHVSAQLSGMGPQDFLASESRDTLSVAHSEPVPPQDSQLVLLETGGSCWTSLAQHSVETKATEPSPGTGAG